MGLGGGGGSRALGMGKATAGMGLMQGQERQELRLENEPGVAWRKPCPTPPARGAWSPMVIPAGFLGFPSATQPKSVARMSSKRALT